MEIPSSRKCHLGLKLLPLLHERINKQPTMAVWEDDEDVAPTTEREITLPNSL